jgi:GcrA cell cycle regulator
MINRPWNADEIARLFDLFKEGKSFSEIAPELGRSRCSCIGVYHREMVKRGHVPTPRKRVLDGTVPKRVYTRAIPAPEVASAGVGFLFPAIAPVIQQRGPLVGLLDVTGCKWPIAEDASLIGGQAFCNCARKPGKPYCSEHAAMAYDPVKKPVPKSIGAYGLRFEKRAA